MFGADKASILGAVQRVVNCATCPKVASSRPIGESSRASPASSKGIDTGGAVGVVTVTAPCASGPISLSRANPEGLLTHQHGRRRCSSGQDCAARAPTRACSTGLGSRSTCSRVISSSSVDQESWSPNSTCGRGPSDWVTPTHRPAISSSTVSSKASSGAKPSTLSAMLPPRSACTVISGAVNSIQQVRFILGAASATPSNWYFRDAPGLDISRTCFPSGTRTRTSPSLSGACSPLKSTRDPVGCS